MADEVRRSGRANKGHHTKNQDALDEPIAKPKQKSKPEKKPLPPAQAQPQAEPARSQSAQSGEQPEEEGEEEEEDAIYRCVCGDQREIRGREMIMCDRCEAWQHNKCLGLPEGDYWTDKTYLCEQCKPEDHAELLAAMARGEKPWNRKKGSKAPRPKFRPSDVGTDAGSEKNESLSSQAPPVQPPTPAAASTQPEEPTPAPSVAATPAKQDSPTDAANGHAGSKSSDKKATPSKSQPQSPQGEKRPHDSIAEKESATVKRRKSSAQHREKPAASTTNVAADPAQLPEKQRLLVEKLIASLSSLIKEASSSRGYRIPDGATPNSIATRLALQIDQATLAYHGEPLDNAAPYSQHFRSILFNTKKNTILLDRLLSGSLSAEELASMTTEEMASEDKQREYAAMREAAEKQMVLTEEPGPRLRKTHKGEEIVGEDDAVPSYSDILPPERVRGGTNNGQSSSAQSPTQDGDETASRAPLAVDTAASQPNHARRQSTTFDVNSVFDKVKSPQNDQHAFLRRRRSSFRQQVPQQGPGDDADVDRLLKDEDNDAEMGGYNSDPTVAWRGVLEMQSHGPVDAVARFVAGGDFGQIIPWDNLLIPRLPIIGRIESQKGNDYIQGLAQSGGYDVGVLAVHPVSAEARLVYDALYNYFHPRDRWGVIPVERLKHEAMRDLYVIPVEPGGSELPPFLNLLEFCSIETPRPEPLLLLALVAKIPEERPQLQPQPQPPHQYLPEPQATPSNGPIPSPAPNPHAPQFSPVQPGFPPGQGFGAPHPSPQDYLQSQPQPQNGYLPQPPAPGAPSHRHTARAVEVFGPYIDSPVVVQFLSSGMQMTDDQMLNLRTIMDQVPAARTDLNVLMEHLRLKNDAQAQI